MLFYLLKSSACLGILLVFYKLVLEKENMHVQKRFYLLFALAISFIIPLITYNTYIEAVPRRVITVNSMSATEFQNTNFILENLSTILWALYAMGVVIFGVRFFRHLYQIIYRIKKNEKKPDRSFVNVLINELLTPHTFFKYIFLNKDQYQSEKIPQEVYWHEQTHALQKHSIDILIIEFIQVILWFNPLIYWAKNTIKLNHEFLADQAVLNKGISTSEYQNTLLNFSSNALQPELVNALNYSLIKKRFTVMKSQSSKRRIGLRYVLLMPLIALLFFSFRTESVIELEKEPIFENETTKLINQEGATKAQIDEYNALAKKLHYTEDKKDKYLVKKKDVERIKYLYGLMTAAQKENAAAFPNIAPPPPPAPAPKKPIVEELPPPPPLVPANATEAQKKKYKEAVKNYKVQHEKAKFKRAKKIEEVERKKLKLQEAKEKREYLRRNEARERAEIAEAVRVERREKAVVEERIQRVKERKEAIVDRNKAMAVERLARAEEREAAIADKQKAIIAERVLRSENRNAALADKKIVAVAERVSRAEGRLAGRAEGIAERKEVLAARVADRKAAQSEMKERVRAERANVAQNRRYKIKEEPGRFVDELAEEGALFYYNDNKIQPHRAKRLLKNKEDINVNVQRNRGSKTRIYLSDNE